MSLNNGYDFLNPRTRTKNLPVKGFTQEQLEKVLEELHKYRPMDMFNNGLSSLQQSNNALLPPRIKMTSKTYLAVANGNVIASDENLDNVKKAAAEFTYKGKASVVIYQPILEISPKYDTVETLITLK